jgi:arylsulfatase A-like enzyme
MMIWNNFFTFLSLLPVVLSATLFAEEKPRNVILILTDDMGIGDFSAYGSQTMSTPNVDRLAAEGMRFTKAYTSGSVCSPTRYGIITGRYPSRGPIKSSGLKFGNPLSIDLDLPVWPAAMKAAGFRTAAIGKWHLGYGKGAEFLPDDFRPGPVDLGFDTHFGVPGNHNDKYHCYAIDGHIPVPKDIQKQLGWNQKPVPGLEPIPRIADQVDTRLTREALSFISRAKGDDQPFFLYLTYCATHTYITPAARFRGTSKYGLLGDYIAEMDHHVGEVLDHLESLGLTEETLIFFSSDNGGQENDIKMGKKELQFADESHDVANRFRTAKRFAREAGHKTNGPLRGYKSSLYEGGFRVPLLARWPGKIPANSTCDTMISLNDLFATTLSLVADEMPRVGEDSLDQSPHLLGEDVGSPIRGSVIMQAGSGALSFRSGNWKLVLPERPKWTSGNIPEFRNGGKAELYDLGADPFERSDLAPAQPAKVAELRELLVGHYK